MTNNFTLKPDLIADLYRQRWRVQLFFKWIKQHLRIKVFFGIGENAVKTQIWIALSTYLLIAIAKKRLYFDYHSLCEILQSSSLNTFGRAAFSSFRAFVSSGFDQAHLETSSTASVVCSACCAICADTTASDASG